MPKKASPDSPEPPEAAGFGLLGDAVTVCDGVVFVLLILRSGLDPGNGSCTSCPPAGGGLPASELLIAAGLVIGGAGSGGVGVAKLTGAVGGSAVLGGVLEAGLRTGVVVTAGGVAVTAGGVSAGSVSGVLFASGSFMRNLPLGPGLLLPAASSVVGELPVATG